MKFDKVFVFFVCLLPLVILGGDIWQEYQMPGSALGADPAVVVVHILGNWAIRFLLLTLTFSSLSRRISQIQLVPYRRMLGLFTFTYAVLHFSAYFYLLAEGQWQSVYADLIKRPYITVGITALILLMPLTITSTRFWQRKLQRHWKKLHRLAYPIALLAVIHVAWLAKSSYLEASVYFAWLACLFIERYLPVKR